METEQTIETKRVGLTFDEALSAAVLGERVTCDLLPAGSYIHYEFNGWRHEFSHNGRIGSSSAWLPDEAHKEVEWRVFDLKPPVVDKWGKPAQAAPAMGKWGPGKP